MCQSRTAGCMQQDGVVVDKPSLNRWAVAGLVVSVAIAAGSLFVLPWLQSQGVSFGFGFWSIVAIEFLAALAVGFFALNIRQDGEIERY